MALIVTGIKDLLERSPAIGSFNSTTATGWSIVYGKVIDFPDQLIIINRSGGKNPNPKWNLDYPSVQIKVRGKNSDYAGGEGKAQAIKDRLLGLPSQDINGDRWTAIYLIADITSLGYDLKERPMWVLNFSLIIEPSSTGNRQS